jgi:ribose 5-phosphate isomerase B
MKVALACDHGAIKHKEAIKAFLIKKGHQVEDFGTYSEDSVDYPDFVYPACKSVVQQKNDVAIVMCGTGIGASIVANKVKGIRCALINEPKVAHITRLHNDTNVLAMGGRLVSEKKAVKIAEVWLSTEFSRDIRHIQRLHKITKVEEAEDAGS